jgi:hypothetical protein
MVTDLHRIIDSACIEFDKLALLIPSRCEMNWFPRTYLTYRAALVALSKLCAYEFSILMAVIYTQLSCMFKSSELQNSSYFKHVSSFPSLGAKWGIVRKTNNTNEM